jgi:neutral trehalase
VNIDALERLVQENGDKLLKQEVDRAERTIDYLRNGAPALQLKKLKSCLVQNKLASVEARAAVLKTMEDWIRKGL